MAGRLRTPPRRSALATSWRTLWIVIGVLLLSAAPAAAQDENRAGLVVVHGDGRVATQCVTFSEPAIGGAELLTRSGLDLAVEASSMGATVCRLDGEGCDFPQESCFCQCQGSPCIYWSYWRLNDGTWRYSSAGAGNTTVRGGDVEGWRWGLGTVEQAEPPPAITFEEICAPAAAMLATADAATTGETVAAPAAGSQADPAAATATLPAPATAFGILLGTLVALPALALIFMWLRRARQS